MTEPITAMGQLVDERDTLRGLLIDLRRFIIGSNTPAQIDRMIERIDAALARDITTALTAPQDFSETEG